ncbi:unnamed protein product [Brachionus calyciflorus]|uniref:Apple domain-containing protein n=1 Tax=Brachionus calyciflorus TaxID=104777 RepID=A0A813XHM7_9BILA|nr:unnamed protein product [Brachionus calyciflorus]
MSKIIKISKIFLLISLLAFYVCGNLKFDDSFVKITSQTLKKYFSCSTILNQISNVQKRVDCFKICSRQNNCEYLKFNSNNCFLYLSLSFNEPLGDGTFWYKNKKGKIFADCTTTTITTTVAFNYNSVLTTKYSISYLINNGFQKVYDQFYSHRTMSSDLTTARSYCNSNSILCAGGGLVDSDILELVACGNCFQILTETLIDAPNRVGSAYWYMTTGKSFGFSPIFTITQNTADTHDYSDPLRLSWHFDQNAGGWRLGTLTSLDNNIQYKKYILVKN